jgi:hypothetical protein
MLSGEEPLENAMRQRVKLEYPINNKDIPVTRRTLLFYFSKTFSFRSLESF